MEHHATEKLNVEMALAECALAGLAHRREGIDQKVVERFAALQPLAQPTGAGLELGIRELLELGLDRIDRIDHLRNALQASFIGASEQPTRYALEHRISSTVFRGIPAVNLA